MAVAKGRTLLLQVKSGSTWLNLAGMQARSFTLNNQEIDSTISPAALTDALWGTAVGGIKSMTLSGSLRVVNEAAERLLWDAAFAVDATIEMRVVLPPAETGQVSGSSVYGASFTGKYTITSFGMSGDLTTVTGMDVSFTSNGKITFAGPVNTTAPVVTSAIINGDRMVLTFSKALKIRNPANTSITWSGAGTSNTTADIEVLGTQVVVSPTTAVTNAHSTVTFSYVAPSTNRFEDADGNAVANISNMAVTNVTP